MKKLLFYVCAILLVALFLSRLRQSARADVLGSFFGSEAPAEASPNTSTFEIEPGMSPRAVIRKMERAGLVKHGDLFYMYAKLNHLTAIKSGEYAIDPKASALEILRKFNRGEVMLHPLSFAEGLHYREIAAQLQASGLISSEALIALCEDKAFLKSLHVEGETCEGYLFPSTYFFAKGTPPKSIVSKLIRQHFEAFSQALLAEQKPFKLTRQEIVTLASIVEKETAAPSERPHIASIFLNRLQKGMRLETDPTVIYAVMRQRGSFDGNLTRADLRLDIPYNTYQRTGLPPGPICNPGLAAITAVIHPQSSDSLYFVSRNDGTHEFCPDYQCHLKAVKRWQVDYFKKPE